MCARNDDETIPCYNFCRCFNIIFCSRHIKHSSRGSVGGHGDGVTPSEHGFTPLGRASASSFHQPPSSRCSKVSTPYIRPSHLRCRWTNDMELFPKQLAWSGHANWLVFVVHWRRFFLNSTWHSKHIRGIIATMRYINWHLHLQSLVVAGRASDRNFSRAPGKVLPWYFGKHVWALSKRVNTVKCERTFSWHTK